MTPEAQKLKLAIANVKPRPDSKVAWLSAHRPSAAMCICLGAGPWKIGRRRTIQQLFLDTLGHEDLSDRRTILRLINASPLEWQKIWFKKIHDWCIEEDVTFDWEFKGNRSNVPDYGLMAIHEIVGRSVHAAPKVIGLFVRDYMFYPTFPADRHVKAWLKENNLPTKPHVIVELFKELRKNPSGYSRAIFDAKAENATFTVS